MVFIADGGHGLLQVYTNGVFGQENTFTPFTLSTGPFPLVIGSMVAQTDSAQTGFYGAIDDVRIYNRALSASEVQQLYVYESQPCIPRRATATAVLNNGFVVGATISDGGCGYTNTPLVLIQGGGGTGATATAVVSNGVVVGITITDAGIGYTNAPTVSIASPPFVPWLEIGVSKVSVTQHVVLGNNYVLESSTDLQNWNQVGPQFTAQTEVITQEFDVDLTGRYFRIRQVP
jgi:hypothetical protein